MRRSRKKALRRAAEQRLARLSVMFERDQEVIRAALDAGVCPCQSDAEDPGPDHLPTCPFSDPDHGDLPW